MRVGNVLKEYKKAKRIAFVFEEIDFMIDRINRATVPGCRSEIKHHSDGLRKLLEELKESG